MPLTSRDSLSRLAIQQIAGSAGSTRYLGRESRPPKTDFEDLSRPENFLIVRIVSLCVGVRPRHNSDWRGGIVPSTLPCTTQDSVLDCWLGFVKAVISNHMCSLSLARRNRHNSDWPGGIVPSRPDGISPTIFYDLAHTHCQAPRSLLARTSRIELYNYTLKSLTFSLDIFISDTNPAIFCKPSVLYQLIYHFNSELFELSLIISLKYG